MAEMGKENLMAWLLESMPMTDITPIDTKQASHITSDTTANSFLEAILLSSIDKLRDLVMEGLQIQVGTKQVVKWQKESMIGPEKGYVNEGGIIMVVLIQARDPNVGYQPVHEIMIGLIEAVNVENGEGLLIKGVHVAGLVARRRNGQVIHNCLWCVSA